MFQIGGKLKSSQKSLVVCLLVFSLILLLLLFVDVRISGFQKHMAFASIFPVKVTVIVIQAFPCRNEHLEILHP